VIAIDTNVLVYAHRRDAEWHAAAAACLRRLAEGTGGWAIPWPCLHEFLAIVTHPRIFSPPSRLPEATDQIDAWLESPTLVVIGEGPGYWTRLRAVLDTGRVTGPRMHDARIAALCLDHGVSELWSADRDFSRFPDLRVVNPLGRSE
jgi:toxin-antitoxin system PIN domain toxin